MPRDQLIAQLNDSFQDLLAAVQDLSDDQMTKVWFGEWGVREILGHIADWHWEMEKAFQRIAAGERPAPDGVDYSDADAWNAKFAAYASSRSPGEVLEDLRAAKEAFIAAALEVPEDRFQEGRAAHRIFFTAGIDHYHEHLPAILDWRKREGI